MKEGHGDVRGYVIEEKAYRKSVLHSVKHLGAVNGLLLGQVTGRIVRVVDALPLTHSGPALYTAPLLELGLLQAAIYAAGRGLALVGCYQANEVATDPEVGVVPVRLADAVRREFPPACLLLMEPARLARERRSAESAWVVFCRAEGAKGWVRAPGQERVVERSTLELCCKDIEKEEMVQRIADFEEHCEDPSRDWMNRKLFG